MGKEYVYIYSGNAEEFNRFKQSHPDVECIYISGVDSLRGRVPGRIKCIGTYEERWDYVGVMESIQRAKEDWKEYFEEKEVDEEIQRTGLTKEDLEYGIE